MIRNYHTFHLEMAVLGFELRRLFYNLSCSTLRKRILTETKFGVWSYVYVLFVVTEIVSYFL
jgi:hypothetical protein